MLAEITIDAAALRHNIALLRRHTGSATAFGAVVKADAYGHGLIDVGRIIAPHVDALCVYEIAEATALRANGIRKPIHVLGPIAPRDFSAALSARVIFPLWTDGPYTDDLARAATVAGVRADVQIKINSGLERLGADPASSTATLAALEAVPEFAVRGAYSHLAAAEELDSRFTLDQLDAFTAAVPAGRVPCRHIAASAAAMLWPQTRLDLIRCGIALYGVWPSALTRKRLSMELPLEPVLSWRTELVAVRRVAAELPIGYGCTYRPAAETWIGVLPIGYAEGLPRLLGNCGEVLVNGKRVPIVGRICMNMTFIDLGEMHVPPGTTVTLIGSDGTERIDAEDVALHAQTIGYEILARLPAHIPRRVISDATEDKFALTPTEE